MDKACGVVCVRHLQEIREVEHLPGMLTNQVHWDGGTLQDKRTIRKMKLKIASDSLQGHMLKYWFNNL
jgi:hypothetical protein